MSGRRATARARWVTWLAAGVLAAATAGAQPVGHPSTGGRSVGDVPAGDGSIRVQVVHPGGAARTAGIDLALYALSPDGVPGLRDGVTDAEGGFVFEGVSRASDIVYLVGARYADVPFGQRVAFTPDAAAVDVEIRVSDPVTDASAVSVERSELRIDWLGASLAAREEHTLRNEAGAVVLVPESAREGADPVFRATLPTGATNFTTAPGSFASGVDQRGDELLFWGPVYPAPQDVRYAYELPVEDDLADGASLGFEGRLASGAETLVVLAPEGGPRVEIEGLAEVEPVELEGRRYRALSGGPFAPGAPLRGSIVLPAASNDPSRIALPRVDLWAERDGAALVVSQEVQLDVAEGNVLRGSPEQPLLRIPLPEGAEVLGVSQEAAAFGVGLGDDGALRVVGPLSPGEVRFGLRYRLPLAQPGADARLRLEFPSEVALLNLLVADTGVEIRDTRLHRRRPVRSGTRTYLHREAFHVEAGRPIDVVIAPLAGGGMPRWASLGLVLLAVVAGAGFVFAPLRPERDDDPGESALPVHRALEREAAIESIRDLDEDFEAGKIAEADYQEMRSALRSRAVALLKSERAARVATAAGAGEEPAPASDASTPLAAGPATGSTAAFCTACGERLRAEWRFCAGCGADLSKSEPPPEEPQP